MDYKGYNIKELKNKVVVCGIKDFDAAHVFECGQCFRWIKESNGSYTVVAMGKVINVMVQENNLHISNSSLEDFTETWYDYFDLGTDYSKIKDTLSSYDDNLKAAIAFGHGIRLLKQDLWEILISFILSARNSIPSIMKSVEKLSEMYGYKITMGERIFYSFPSQKSLATATIPDLLLCKGSFRCKYIQQAALDIQKAAINLKNIFSLETQFARDELMKLKGVGPKVADCSLLFSGLKTDVFPTDLWVKRIMEELYFKRPASFKEIQNFATEEFGNLAGIAQQYLFYYARQNKIGVS